MYLSVCLICVLAITAEEGRSDDLQKMHFEAISPTLVVAAAAARQKPLEIDVKIKPAKIFLYPDDLHRKTPIFRVKSVKIYTGQKNLH